MRFWRLSSSAWTSPAACWVARNASTRGVCNCPGNTVLIRTPCLAYSTAATRPNCITPAFAAAYPTWGAPVQRIADVEETLTTAPLPCRAMRASTCRHVVNTEVRFKSSCRCQSASDSAVAPPGMGPPTLLTRISMRPNWRTALSTRPRTASPLDRAAPS
ncbi:hypothetical protein G6F40_015088 [Rhizopus arrhizus]|nr:hypothetical protein G6F40_015088 [Rhizopus arrhizus]